MNWLAMQERICCSSHSSVHLCPAYSSLYPSSPHSVVQYGKIKTKIIFMSRPTICWRALCFIVVCPSVHQHIFCVTRYLSIYWTDFNETCHKYSSREWTLPKRFSRSEVKGQGHNLHWRRHTDRRCGVETDLLFTIFFHTKLSVEIVTAGS